MNKEISKMIIYF